MQFFNTLLAEIWNYLLSLFLLGEGEFGQRSIIDHAIEYLECAQQHPHLFRTPKVMWAYLLHNLRSFYFTNIIFKNNFI
jgi:hypothetical protein